MARASGNHSSRASAGASIANQRTPRARARCAAKSDQLDRRARASDIRTLAGTPRHRRGASALAATQTDNLLRVRALDPRAEQQCHSGGIAPTMSRVMSWCPWIARARTPYEEAELAKRNPVRLDL